MYEWTKHGHEEDEVDDQQAERNTCVHPQNSNFLHEYHILTKKRSSESCQTGSLKESGFAKLKAAGESFDNPPNAWNNQKEESQERRRETRVSLVRERERKTPSPPKLFYSSPISFHLSRTKNSLPLASPVSLPKKKVPNTSSIFRAGSPGLSFTQDTISLDHQRMRSAIWWIERLVSGERLERYSLQSRTGR